MYQKNVTENQAKWTISQAVFNIKQLMQYTGLSRARAEEFGRAAGALIPLSEKRRGYLKSKIDEELKRRAGHIA